MMRSTESKAMSFCGVYAMARKMPDTIMITSMIPASEPKFHQ
jgi:hypothetical protein